MNTIARCVLIDDANATCTIHSVPAASDPMPSVLSCISLLRCNQTYVSFFVGISSRHTYNHTTMHWCGHYKQLHL